MSVSLAYSTPMIDPYRLTLPQDASSAIIPKPTTVITDPYQAKEELLNHSLNILKVPGTGQTNIVNPTLTETAIDPVPAPSSDDGNGVVLSPPIADPADTVPITNTPKWLAWVKANPLPAAAIAFAAFYIGKSLLHPKQSRK